MNSAKSKLSLVISAISLMLFSLSSYYFIQGYFANSTSGKEIYMAAALMWWWSWLPNGANLFLVLFHGKDVSQFAKIIALSSIVMLVSLGVSFVLVG